MIEGEALTLSVAIQKSGNFTEWANQGKVKLTRLVGGKPEDKEYDVEKIIRDNNPNADPVLENGDRVFVPKTWFRIK